MESREREGHLQRLSAMFRQRRFDEAMEYLDQLELEERKRLSRLLGEQRPEDRQEAG